MTPPAIPKLRLRGLLYAWCNIFLISMAWAPYVWLVNQNRARSAWESTSLLGGLLTGHELAAALLVLHSLLIMLLLGMQLLRD